MGLFITFEGGEGAGKTTLIEAIANALTTQGHSVLKTREPGGTPLGEQIRALLLDQGKMSPYAEFALFLASRAQQVQEVIAPALKENKIVLCDRFNDSSIAYQGIGRDLGKKEVASTCDFFSQNLKPDLTLYLDIDPKLGLTRAGEHKTQDRIEKEDLAFHTKIREAYKTLQKEEPQRFHLLDASLPPTDVFTAAMQKIEPLLSKV